MTDRVGVDRVLDVPQGRFELRRHPDRPRRPLRAWDAADEYLLHHLVASEHPTGATVLLNDAFGALAVALGDRRPTVVNESANGRLALAGNHSRNGLTVPVDEVDVVSIVDRLPVDIGLLVVKVPRSLGQLEDQLHRVRPHLRPDATIVGAAMVKHVHTSTIERFESILGPTSTSLARKKARLLHTRLDESLRPDAPAWPHRWRHDGFELVNHGGVFSSLGIDDGTAVLLDALDAATDGLDPAVIVDLGCGNGIVGLDLGRRFPSAALVFLDESMVAIRSAFESWEANGGGDRAVFRCAPRLAGAVDKGSVDLVVVNPPLHVAGHRGDDVAFEMFVDAHRVLRPGGRLVVVGNRDLGHHAKLGKIFGGYETVAADRRFVVLVADR